MATNQTRGGFNSSKEHQGPVDALILGLVEAIVYIIVYVLSKALGLLWFGGKTALSWWGSRGTSSVARSEPVVAQPVEAAPPELPGAAVFLRDKSSIPEAGELRRVDLKGAHLNIRYYASSGSATAKMTVSSQKLARRLGFKMTTLTPLKVTSIAEATSRFKDEAMALLLQPENSVVPATAAPKVSAPIEQVQVVEEEFAPIPPQQADSLVAPAPARKRQPRKQLTYTGFFLEGGMAKRTQGDRSFDQYRVLLDDDKLGAGVPVWGTDLERVINEHQVVRGDRIEIALVGDTDVMVKGARQAKKVFALTKL